LCDPSVLSELRHLCGSCPVPLFPFVPLGPCCFYNATGHAGRMALMPLALVRFLTEAERERERERRIALSMALPPPPGPVQLHFYNGHSFLYCHDCHCVTVPSGLVDHMLRLHKPLPSALRRRVVRYYTTTTLSSEDLITQHEQMAQLLPPYYSLPLPFLPTKGGFACGFACGFDSCRFLPVAVRLIAVHYVRHSYKKRPCTSCARASEPQ
jgi:hypothetical protein